MSRFAFRPIIEQKFASVRISLTTKYSGPSLMATTDQLIEELRCRTRKIPSEFSITVLLRLIPHPRQIAEKVRTLNQKLLFSTGVGEDRTINDKKCHKVNSPERILG